MLTFLWELVIQFFVQLPIEVFLEKSPGLKKFSIGVSLFAMGGVAGWLVTWAFPARQLPASPIPGTSLLLTPIAAGLLMREYGRWLERRGHVPTFGASFWGGWLFAFGMASARFLLVQS